MNFSEILIEIEIFSFKKMHVNGCLQNAGFIVLTPAKPSQLSLCVSVTMQDIKQEVFITFIQISMGLWVNYLCVCVMN